MSKGQSREEEKKKKTTCRLLFTAKATTTTITPSTTYRGHKWKTGDIKRRNKKFAQRSKDKIKSGKSCQPPAAGRKDAKTQRRKETKRKQERRTTS
jgi:hypothetical protein